MEYFLSRALEVCRLSEDQLYVLHEKDKLTTRSGGKDARGDQIILHREPRCMFPNEIQEAFGLPSLKEHYEIPADNDAAQSAHNQRLRGEFRVSGLYPASGDLTVDKVEQIHSFDERVRAAEGELKINLRYSLGAGKRRRASDDL